MTIEDIQVLVIMKRTALLYRLKNAIDNARRDNYLHADDTKELAEIGVRKILERLKKYEIELLVYTCN